MCLRYPQASSMATLPTGSMLHPPPQHGCILPSPPKTKQKTKKTWLTNLFDSTVSVYFRNLLTLIISVE